MEHGRISNAKTNIILLAANLPKMHMGLRLSAQDEACKQDLAAHG